VGEVVISRFRPGRGGGIARAHASKSALPRTKPAAKLAKHSGVDLKKIEKDCDRNLWLDPAEATRLTVAPMTPSTMPEAIADAS
jgi:hypothetical protein